MIKQRYEVNRDGTVTPLIGQHKGKPLKIQPPDTRGYPFYVLLMCSKPRRYCAFPVHTLVANFYIPNPFNKPMVNHIDGNKLNYALENLEWVTNKENCHHAISTGLTNQLGQNHSQAKLCDADIHEMFKVYRPGMSPAEFERLNKGKTSEHNLGNIFHGYRWVHITSQYGVVPKVKRVHQAASTTSLTA